MAIHQDNLKVIVLSYRPEIAAVAPAVPEAITAVDGTTKEVQVCVQQ